MRGSLWRPSPQCTPVTHLFQRLCQAAPCRPRTQQAASGHLTALSSQGVLVSFPQIWETTWRHGCSWVRSHSWVLQCTWCHQSSWSWHKLKELGIWNKWVDTLKLWRAVCVRNWGPDGWQEWSSSAHSSSLPMFFLGLVIRHRKK